MKRYGKLKLSRVLQPAIRLADEGVEVTILQRALARRDLKHLRAGSAASLFLREGRKTYLAGTVFKQPALAETLRRIAKRGVKDFYTGQIAARIHDDMERNNGFIRKDDLAQIPLPIERRPLTTRFHGQRVFTFPLPGAGRTLIEMMNVYQQLPPSRADIDTPQGAIVLAEMIRRALIDRQDRPFDPSFFPQVRARRMRSPEYAKKLAKECMRRIKTQGETTHVSVMDAEGNAVGLTQSIERVFGSFAATEDLGFLYNNYMNAFEYENISHPYYLRPNAVPWASVAPTILFRGKRPWLVIGSPGSERITPAILQVLIRLETHTPFAAVDAPRLHCSLKGKVSLEATRMRSDVPDALRGAGFEVEVRDPYSFYMGCVQLAMRRRGGFVGIADPRRDGSAAGPGSTTSTTARSSRAALLKSKRSDLGQTLSGPAAASTSQPGDLPVERARP